MTMTSTSAGSAQRTSWLAKAFGIFGHALETLSRWQTVRFEREHLASFDDRMLRDVGLSRADVEREYRKPFWRT